MNDARSSNPKLSSLYKTPGSIKTLRASYKGATKPLSIEHLLAEVMGQSDRATIILLSSLIEEATKVAIAVHLSIRTDDPLFDEVFRFSGPMGSFSHRNEIALLFGVIDINTFNQLNALREVRNACAHSRFDISFNKQEIKSVIERMFCPTGTMNPNDNTIGLGYRECFTIECVIIYQTVLSNRGAALKSLSKMFEALRRGPSAS